MRDPRSRTVPADDPARLWRDRVAGASLPELPGDWVGVCHDRVAARTCSSARSVAASPWLAGDGDDASARLLCYAVAVATWIARVTREREVVVGVGSVHGTWPLRLDIGLTHSARELLQTARETSRDAARFPPPPSATSGFRRIGVVQGDAAPFDLTLHADDDRLVLSGCYASVDLDRWVGEIAQLAAGIASAPDRPVRELAILDDAERAALLALSRGPCVAYPFTPVDLLVREQAARAPHALAVVHGAKRLTYTELVARANRLAHWLRQRAPIHQTPVATCVARSPELMVAELAALTACRPFVAIDPEAPPERVAVMIAESKAPLALATRGSAASLKLAECEIVVMEDLEAALDGQPDEPPAFVTRASDLAYIVFTSGSTGVPKGVQAAHAGLANLLLSDRRCDPTLPTDRVTQIGSPGFDASIDEMFRPLANGATVMIIPDDVRKSPRAFVDWVRDERVTMAGLPAPLFEACQDEDWTGHVLRRIGTGLDKVVIRKPPPAQMSFGYGPTECTIGSIHLGVVTAFDSPPPIGVPIDNTSAYLLDHRLELVPRGARGEIYLAGVCVTRGYLRADATAERFVPDPHGPPGSRMYRTGDVAYWRSDGLLQFVGRADHQIKVRGYRIEPSEIEAALAADPGVREAVVVARARGADSQLVAYLVAKSGAQPSPDAMIESLRARLPEYMIPRPLIFVDALPLTTSGKVDRKALAARPIAERAYVPPRDELEETLARAWADTFGLASVGRDDGFFELGGHSLLAARLGVRARELGLALDVRAVFEAPTLRDMADWLRRQEATNATPALVPQPHGSRAPATSWQRVAWKRGNDPVHNICCGVQVRRPFDITAFSKAVAGELGRHEILRTRFEAHGGELEQIIDSARDIVECVDASSVSVSDREAHGREVARAELGRRFTLAGGPLFRVLVVRFADDANVVLALSHRILIDPPQLDAFFQETFAIYDAERSGKPSPLVEAPLQYADYALWRREIEGTTAYLASIERWKARMRGAEPAALPLDRPSSARNNLRHDHLLDIAREAPSAVAALARSERTTHFGVISAAMAALIHRLTKQEHVVMLGLTDAARSRAPALSQVFGRFMDFLVLRVDMSGRPSFRDVVRRTSDAIAFAMANLDVPAADILGSETVVDSPFARLIVTMFYANRQPPKLQSASAEWIHVPWPPPRGYEISWSAEERSLTSEFAVSAESFDAATASALAKRASTLFAAAIVDPDTSIDRLPF